MKSETSYSKRFFYPTLWKKNMTRFWPIWALYGVCWLFAMPIYLLTQNDGRTFFATHAVRQFAAYGSLTAAVVFGLLSAMAVFSYLYNNRSAGLIHALPVRREGLFCTNYLSGLSFMLLPTAAIFVLTALAEVVKGCLDLQALGAWLASQIMMTLFFYSFAVFCAMFTGHILALPAFYGILNGLVAGLALIIGNMVQQFVYGYAGGNMDWVLWLTPVAKLGSEVRVYYEEASARLVGLGYALVYAVVGLVLAALALLIYRRRHLESAGDVVTVRWVRPIFKYGVAFCTALALGTFLYVFFGFGLTGAWALLGFMLLCGAVGYFVAEMLLKKKFNIFAGSWKGLAVFSLCLVAAVSGLELDVTGYERWVPDPEQLVSVSLQGGYSSPTDMGRYDTIETTDPELIRAVTELHQVVVAEKGRFENGAGGYGYENNAVLPDGTVVREVQTMGSRTLSFAYETIGGSHIYRRYDISVTAEDLKDPDSLASKLSALLNRPEVLEEAYFPAHQAYLSLGDIRLEVWNTETGEIESVSVPVTAREAVVAALKSDIAGGRLGRRYLLDDADRLMNCYYTDLYITYRDVADGSSRENSVTLQTTSTDTLKLLRELGVLDDTHILKTQAEVQHESWLGDQVNASEEYAEYARG